MKTKTTKASNTNAKKLAGPGIAKAKAKRDERLPAPGSVLTREHGGKIHRVTIREDGAFTYKGHRYTSLSTIAREITGTIWNGFLFFNLLTPAKKKKAA